MPVPLLCNLVNSGITVATLSPSETVYERGSDLTALVLAVIEFGRGHGRSETQRRASEPSLGAKARAARPGAGTILTKHPGWVAMRDDKLVLNAERAGLVRRMYALAAQGYGLSLIVKELTRETSLPGGAASTWSKAYLHKILTSRASLRKCLPLTKERLARRRPNRRLLPCCR